MKYVFSSNGEEHNYPTFFVTLYSGSSTAQNGDVMRHQVHTAYDVGTHDVPASGVVSDTALGYTSQTLNIVSQTENTHLTMAGDAEMIHVVSRKETTKTSSTMDNIYFGRFNSFDSVDDNPYPLICQGGTSFIITDQINARGIGGNPPQGFQNNGEMLTMVFNLNDAQQPYQMGVDSIFFAQPIVVAYSDPTPIRKGIAGTVRNGWRGADATSLLNLSILTASGTAIGVQTYQSFTRWNSVSNPSLILRKS
jgi:hypothetical protein